MGGYLAILDETLNAIGDAVRAKANLSGDLSIQEMIAAINSIIVHTNEDIDGIIMRTSEIIESNTAQYVADYAFFGNPSIRTVVLPNATMVGNYAFCDCVNLERISTGATEIGAYAFYGCDELNEILFSQNLSSIGVAAFDGCSSLECVDLRGTSVLNILPSAFADSGLRELWLPGDRFCMLTNASAFTNSPLAQDGPGGIIHLPRKYRVEYEANTIWAKILGNGTNRVVAY